MTALAAWACGRARYFIDRESPNGRLVTAVECRLPTATPARHLALLDTGAQWSIVGGEFGEELLRTATVEQRIRLSTRLGTYEASLARQAVTLLAEDGFGVDLVVEGPVALIPEWTGPVVLGTRGILERVRFELDPDQTAEDSWWSFGESLR